MAIFFVPVFFFAALTDSQTEEDPATGQVERSIDRPTARYLVDGESGMLNTNDDLSDCTGEVAVAFTQEALHLLTKAANVKDAYGYAEVFTSGLATIVPNCTNVKAIDHTFSTRKVRLIDDPAISGWVPYEWARGI